MENIREIILELLLQWEKEKSYSNLLIRDVLDKYDYLDARDKAFIKKVSEGTIEQLMELDAVLNQFSKTPVKKMRPFIRNLLRMSVYQLFYMDAVPDSAVCNEAVKLATKHKFSSLKGFINGVLRNIARQKRELLSSSNQQQSLSIRYSMPEWILKLWERQFPQAVVTDMLEAMNRPQPVMVRIGANVNFERKEQLIEAWQKQGVEVTAHPWLSYAYALRRTAGIASLPGFEEGEFIVQDISSMLVCEAAGLDGMAERRQKEGERLLIMDTCAAPGGKTLHAAEKIGNAGDVWSMDLTDKKVSKISENANRLQQHNVRIMVQDATQHRQEWEKKADVLLTDVPCSGLGIMGKKRDIKYRLQEEQLAELHVLQKNIMRNVVSYLKDDGVLIYSTCTIHEEENQAMVAFIEEELGLRPESLLPYLPNQVIRDIQEIAHNMGIPDTLGEGYLQLLPGLHPCDGFFLARFRKR